MFRDEDNADAIPSQEEQTTSYTVHRAGTVIAAIPEPQLPSIAIVSALDTALRRSARCVGGIRREGIILTVAKSHR